ncbi:MAG: ABC transporter permease [Burkholderiales bacterium]|jgi:simple sugar transport system permease protein|nr:ABC transporter permease [Burkholderiales bacterium]
MMLRLEPRPEPSRLAVWLSPLAALLATLVIGAAVFAWLGFDPWQALFVFFVTPVNSWYGVSELLLKAAPLILIANGLALGFRANVWNIGAEGQLILGALGATGIALAFDGVEAYWLLPLMLVCGTLGGMAWAAIPAFLRTRFRTNEILVSLMLVYIAGYLLSFLIHGPWRDPEGYNFPESKLFSASALLPIVSDEVRLNISIFFALGVALLCWFFIKKSWLGFQMRVAGLAPTAALYAGIPANRTVWIGLLAGGAGAGLAGACEVVGPLGQLTASVSPGYGFAAIIVAFVGRLHPIGIVFSGLLLSLLYLGGESAQIHLGLPSAVTGLFQGALLFVLLGADVFIRYRLRFFRSATVEAPSLPESVNPTLPASHH